MTFRRLPSAGIPQFAVTFVLSLMAAGSALAQRQAQLDSRDDASPWEINEHWSAHTPIDPILDRAGVRWVRAFGA
jgi:hypothetical protein